MTTPSQLKAIEQAINILKEAEIDARLSELFTGGDKCLTIVMRNIEGIDKCPHGNDWDDCPDCRH